MTATKLFFLNILLIIIFNLCYGCIPLDYNLGNSDSIAEDLQTILDPLRSVISQYNDTSVPNAKTLLDEYLANNVNEDKYLNFTQLVTKYGYPVEQHEVETVDGYLLTLFRIPKKDGPVALIMPGLLCSSDNYIVTGPDSGLAYVLADNGYDVWLGNSRGCKYGRRHISLSPNCGEFWDFCIDELGRYDLPAIIDYTLNATNSNKLMYVGHSAGTIFFFVMCSVKPEYNDKINLMIALSADAFYGHNRSPLFRLASLFASTNAATVLARAIGLYEFVPSDSFMKAVLNLFCGTPETAELICNNLLSLFFGFDYQQVNTTNLPVIWSHFPAGTSTKHVLHYAQLTASKKFRNYDYSLVENLERYGTIEPPDYPLERVTCPVVIFYGMGDWVTSPADIEHLLSLLTNVVEFIHVPLAKFDHIDFIWAKDVKKLVYEELLRVSSKYTK